VLAEGLVQPAFQILDLGLVVREFVLILAGSIKVFFEFAASSKTRSRQSLLLLELSA